MTSPLYDPSDMTVDEAREKYKHLIGGTTTLSRDQLIHKLLEFREGIGQVWDTPELAQRIQAYLPISASGLSTLLVSKEGKRALDRQTYDNVGGCLRPLEDEEKFKSMLYAMRKSPRLSLKGCLALRPARNRPVIQLEKRLCSDFIHVLVESDFMETLRQVGQDVTVAQEKKATIQSWIDLTSEFERSKKPRHELIQSIIMGFTNVMDPTKDMTRILWNDFVMNAIRRKQFKLLEKMINNDPKGDETSATRVLSLGGCRLNVPELNLVAEILSCQNSGLKSIELHQNKITVTGMQKLAIGLRSSMLSSLDLHDNKLGWEGLAPLAHIFSLKEASPPSPTPPSTPPEEIVTKGERVEITSDSKGQYIGEEGHVVAVKEQGVKIRFDNSSCAHFNFTSLRPLGYHTIVSTLTTLFLNSNDIGSKGAELLADMLRHPKTSLSLLDIHENNIDGKGIWELAMALTRGLKWSDVSGGRPVRGRELFNETLKEALRQNTVLQPAQWAACRITDLRPDDFVQVGTAFFQPTAQNSSLKTLLVYKNKLGSHGASALAYMLLNNKTLTKLDAATAKLMEVEPEGRKDISIKGFSEIAKALEVNDTLTHLDLSNNPPIGGDEDYEIAAKHISIPEDSMKLLTTALKANVYLRELLINANAIGNDGARVLCETLETQQTSIRLLSLVNNRIDENMILFAKMLSSNTSLFSIDLSDNVCDDESAAEFATCLQTNRTLTCLKLGQNQLSNTSVLRLAQALYPSKRGPADGAPSGNAHLKELDLSKNHGMGPAQLEAFASLLENGSSLTSLDVGGSKGLKWSALGHERPVWGIELTNEGLSDALQDSTELGWDDWDSYRIPSLRKDHFIRSSGMEYFKPEEGANDDVAGSFAKALKSNQTLTSLALNASMMTDHGAKKIADSLVHNKTLTTLELQENNIGDEGAHAFTALLLQNDTLSNLHLSDNPFQIQRFPTLVRHTRRDASDRVISS